jgi:integrase
LEAGGAIPRKMKIKLSFYDAGGDLSKPWFISITSPGFPRLRVYKSINKHKTAQWRKRAINKHLLELQTLIDQGLNPWKDGLPDDSKPKIPKKGTFQAAVAKFLESRTGRKKTIQTIESIFRTFGEYLMSIETIQLKRITKINCLDYFEWLKKVKGNGDTTSNNHLAKLKQLFKYLKERELVNENPFETILQKSVESEGKWPFKDHQRRILKDTLIERDPYLWLFIQFMFYMFIRPGELRQIKLEYIDLDEATITIPAEIAKNKKTQKIVIPDSLIPVVYDLELHKYNHNCYLFTKKGIPGDSMVGINHMNYRHSKFLKEKGFSDKYSIYSWKGTGAVAAVKAGVNLKELKEQLRHSSLDMTDKYLKKQGFIEMDDIRRNFPSI